MAILCLGEILVDRFDDLPRPGGAPANLACHAAALGADAALVSRVGEDAAGTRLAGWLRERGVVAHLQRDPRHPTGSVEVMPGPRYEIATPAAWDFIEFSEELSDAAARSELLVFGTLAQRYPVSRDAIRSLVVSARRAGVAAFCDLNLRAPFYDTETVLWCLRNCDVLKLNREETAFVSAMLGASGGTAELFTGLLREFSIARGVLTAGEADALFFDHGEVFAQPAEKVPAVADEVGAGDAFGAVVAVALARGLSLRRAAEPAAALAAHVVSRHGATPEIPPALTARLKGMLSA